MSQTRGLRSLISCLQPLNVSLYQRGAFLQDRNGGCCFDDDWVCPLVLETDDNLQCRCLEREWHALDCGWNHFSLSLCMIVEWQSDLRATLLFVQSKWVLSQFRVVAPFLWCQKLYSCSETTESAVWTRLGHRVQFCLAQNPSICSCLNETLRSHQTFLKLVSNHSVLSGHRHDRGKLSNKWRMLDLCGLPKILIVFTGIWGFTRAEVL